MARSTAEAAFLAQYDPSLYPRPSVAVDVAVLSVVDGRLRAVLVRRVEHPFLDAYALPGGFVRMEESLDQAAARVLRTKAQVADVYLEQLQAFGGLDRDPRMRVVTVAYTALVRPEVAPGSFPLEVPWEGDAGGPVRALGPEGPLEIAFDHAEILGVAVQRLRRRLDHDPIAAALLPARFTLRQLQEVHEAILGRAVNKDSFRRRLLSTGQLQETGELEREVGHRPAALYQYDPARGSGDFAPAPAPATAVPPPGTPPAPKETTPNSH